MGTRIKVVWPGSGPRARLRKFYVFSAVTHVLLAVAFIFIPRLFGGPRPNFSDDFLDNAIFAELVGGIDEPTQTQAPARATPAVESEPEPEPEPPKPQPAPEPEDTPAAGDVEFSKRADPTPAKEDPKPAPTQEPASGDSGADERVGDSGGGVQGGGEVSLFGWYQGSVSRALYASWQRPLLAGLRDPLAVLISFNIQKDGSVSGLAVVESSGVPALDRSALRAVADASPLPRLPPAWRGSSMTAAYTFEITPEDF